MFSRLIFTAVALFWVTMNVLLWRAEFGSHDAGGIPVPAEAVWRKVLTSPDDSSLNILHHGAKIGFCHWTTSVSEEAGQIQETPSAPDEVKRVPGYRVQVEGNWRMSATNRAHISGTLVMATSQDWRELRLRVDWHDAIWELKASSAEKTVQLKLGGDGFQFERTFQLSQLQNPGALLDELTSSSSGGMADSLEVTTGLFNVAGLARELKWEAHSEVIQVKHASMRVFRLETQLLNRYKVVILVSRVGEILQVKFGDEVVLLHDWLGNL